MSKILAGITIVIIVAVSVYWLAFSKRPPAESPSNTHSGSATAFGTAESTAVADAQADGHAVATFAGGCFWCMEPPFDKLDGVISTTSGYTGGELPNPTYEEVSAGGTGHLEAIEVVYDPEVVTYEQLLEVFWKNVDPTQADGQFCDVGDSYRSAIFVHDDAQRQAAEHSLATVREKFSKAVATEILPAGDFYIAESYHQDYYKKNPWQYRYYRFMCGRDSQLQEVWDGK